MPIEMTATPLEETVKESPKWTVSVDLAGGEVASITARFGDFTWGSTIKTSDGGIDDFVKRAREEYEKTVETNRGRDSLKEKLEAALNS